MCIVSIVDKQLIGKKVEQVIDEKKLLEKLEELKFANEQKGYDTAKDIIQEIINLVNEQPKADWIPCEDVLSMSESDFITHILSTICDYAKVNNYEITETVKAMGENLITLTEIANFDKWKEGVTDDE